MTRRQFSQLADWEIRHRFRVAFALVAISLIALGFLTRLKFDFRPEALTQFSHEEQTFIESFNERFNIEENVLLVVVKGSRPGAMLEARGLTLLHQLSEITEENDIAAQVIGLTRLPRRDAASGLTAFFTAGRIPPLIDSLPVDAAAVSRARHLVESSRLIPGQLISRDGLHRGDRRGASFHL